MGTWLTPAVIITGLTVLGASVWSVTSYAEEVATTPESDIGKTISKNAFAFGLILVAVVLLIAAGRRRT